MFGSRVLPHRIVVAVLIAIGLGARSADAAEHGADAKAASKPAGVKLAEVKPTESAPERGAEDKLVGKGAGQGSGKVETKPTAKVVAHVEPQHGAKHEAKAEAKGAVAVDPAGEPAEPVDPMDALRDRLERKLAGAKVAAADDRSVLRVTSNAADVASPVRPGSASARESAPGALRPPRRGHAAPLSAHAAEAAAPARWDYAGAGGPQRWAELNPAFAKCGSGTRQSPIDIRDGIAVDLEPVRFDYKPTAFRVIDTGRTVQVRLGAGNAIEVMGRRYELVDFDFQFPSEERIDGRQFDMGVHLTHRDAEGRLAVVAVLLNRGDAQPVVQSVWNNLPLEQGEELAAPSLLNPTDLLPTQRGYYTYMGSLTTPPCSEGVLWLVMKQPVPVSTEQLGVFGRLYPMNARPVQSAAGRLIKQSN